MPCAWSQHLSRELTGGSWCAARQNFNVVRMFGFPVQRGFNLQTSAGVYNEQVRHACGPGTHKPQQLCNPCDFQLPASMTSDFL